MKHVRPLHIGEHGKQLLTVAKQTEIESESAGETKGLFHRQTAESFVV